MADVVKIPPRKTCCGSKKRRKKKVYKQPGTPK
jgi:hypothetical protein